MYVDDDVDLSLSTDYLWMIAVILFLTVVLILTTVAIAMMVKKGTHIS